MSAIHIVGVMLGGALGSLARYVITYGMLETYPNYRGMGTLISNVAGCLLIGFLAGGVVEHRWLSTEWRTFLVTGLLGGLTTFSALSLETVLLSRAPGHVWVGAGHLAANLILGIGAVLLGGRLAALWSV